MNHHEEAIDEALLMRSRRTTFVSKGHDGDWYASSTLPRASAYYSVTAEGEVFWNTHEEPKPIRVRARDARA